MKSIRKKIDVIQIGPCWGSFTDRTHFRRLGFVRNGIPMDQTKLLFTQCKVVDGGLATMELNLFIPTIEFEENTGTELIYEKGEIIWIATFKNPIGANTKLRPRKIYVETNQ